MIREPLLCVSLLVTTPLWAAASRDFAAPPPNLLYQLQKQNRSRPWLRVTLDSSRADLRAQRVDALGLGGLESRGPNPPPPDPIAWRSIARIDEVVTRARAGKVTGFILAGALGAGLGNAIGAGMRTNRTVDSYQYTEGHGGVGAWLGLVVFGGLGAWQGGRLGERMSHERPWYLGAPSLATQALATPPATAPPVPAATQVPTVTPPPAPASRTERIATDISQSPGVLRACARIDRGDLFRMRGDFGQFQGYADVIGPQGMEGLRADPAGHDYSSAVPPVGRVTWDRIGYVDKRGSGAGRGALMGAASFGAVGGVISFAVIMGLQGTPSEGLAALAVGGATMGAIGAGFGALVGAAVPAWHNVYHGP